MTPLTVLVTGSRNWTDVATIRVALDAAVTGALWQVDRVEPLLVHGACPFRTVDGLVASADILASNEAYRRGWARHAMSADWQEYGRRAGPIRNREMVDFVMGRPGIRVAVAFPLPESRGTLDCIRQARAAGIPVAVWRPGADVDPLTSWHPHPDGEPDTGLPSPGTSTR